MAKALSSRDFQSLRLLGVFAAGLATAALAACSHHPKLEDVSPLRSEKIVEHVRCEARATIVRELMTYHNLANEEDLMAKLRKFKEIAESLDAESRNNLDLKFPAWLAADRKEQEFLAQLEAAIAYDFDFNIVEDNAIVGAVGFQIPYTPPGSFDLNAGAKAAVQRAGQRQFKAQEKWATLIEAGRTACKKIDPRSARLDYPITGRSGMDDLITTFLGVYRQGISKDSFVETLTFTTDVGASVAGGLKLTPVPNNFRVVGASAVLTGNRRDVHKMVVSMIFPQEFRLGKSRMRITDAPFDRPPKWRARYNLCVADARQREDKFNALHHQPPELYCIRYAESFVPPPRARLAQVFTPTTAPLPTGPAIQGLRKGEKEGPPPRRPQSRMPRVEGDGFDFLYYGRVRSYLDLY